MGRQYFDKELAEAVPNKYNLTPKSIKKLVVADWDALKKKTWHNEAMKDTGEWWCHLEGSHKQGEGYDDSDEFWIGFRENDDKVDCNFSCYEGMCKYLFNTFYDPREIENVWDMRVQVNTLKWLNEMLDAGILATSKEALEVAN